MSRTFESNDAQRLYRQMREKLNSDDAIKTVVLITGEQPIPPNKTNSMYFLGGYPPGDTKHGLPYYHGPKRRF
ncbi:hypothetical protein Axy10_028 [Achromobacter phage vB_AxyP_19-32_Axy10]|uniref:Uncharacterized protein n=1 Tax=Achromobacter phage vB_AxyP_19-32_Axy10 TaxID=2591041 RepID=A0A514CU30_9CAUD|nr:hypothetical protein KMC59_gp28 [Achromobacter phage vB_AxyP_19-32_Axy10]QDH83981.1 hypothetical protein Axy10_028 [Achromobacter phage vB_AxyP_19-32_Axy10]